MPRAEPKSRGREHVDHAGEASEYSDAFHRKLCVRRFQRLRERGEPVAGCERHTGIKAAEHEAALRKHGRDKIMDLDF